MKAKRFTPCNLGKNTICLGKQGEAKHLRIEFDCSGWLAEFRDGVVVLYHFPAGKKSADKPHLETVGTDRVWTVSAEDTVYAGDGVIELVLEDAETAAVLKSATGYTSVTYSPSAMPLSEDGEGDDEGGGGGTGEDGGYYKPSVSSSGVLSWQPSKSGMPSVPSSNVKGQKGDKGDKGDTGDKGEDGQAATFELVGADSLPYGSTPTVTEQPGSTAKDRKYRVGIPEGKPGAPGNGDGGSVELDSTLTDYQKAANAGAVGNALEQEKQARNKAIDELKEANAAQDKLIANKLDTSALPTAINTALEQAKASGQFDGKDGEPGKDYVLTEADKEEIAEMAAEKVEVPEGGGGSGAGGSDLSDVLSSEIIAEGTIASGTEAGYIDTGVTWGDLREYDVLSFWAKASSNNAACAGILGLGSITNAYKNTYYVREGQAFVVYAKWADKQKANLQNIYSYAHTYQGNISDNWNATPNTLMATGFLLFDGCYKKADYSDDAPVYVCFEKDLVADQLWRIRGAKI